MTTTAPEAVRSGEPGGMIGMLAIVVAGLWIAGTIAAAFALLGSDRVMALRPVELGALAAAAILPALMAIFSGMAARDSARARAEARAVLEALAGELFAARDEGVPTRTGLGAAGGAR